MFRVFSFMFYVKKAFGVSSLLAFHPLELGFLMFRVFSFMLYVKKAFGASL
jgi:hypothetical protein